MRICLAWGFYQHECLINMQDDGKFQEYLCNFYLSPSHAYHPSRLATITSPHPNPCVHVPKKIRLLAALTHLALVWAQSTTGPISERDISEKSWTAAVPRESPLSLSRTSLAWHVRNLF
jgi:hypothetical protein